MKLFNKILMLIIIFVIVFSSIIPAMAYNGVYELAETQVLQEALDSALEQLKEQNAEHMFPLFEEMNRRQFNLSNESENDYESIILSNVYYTSDGTDGVIKYHSPWGDVDVVETYYGLTQTRDLYFELVDPGSTLTSVLINILEEIAGYFSFSIGTLRSHFERTVTVPVKNLYNANKRAVLFTSKDNFDMGRVTTVVSEWRKFPIMSRPSGATNVDVKTSLR